MVWLDTASSEPLLWSCSAGLKASVAMHNKCRKLGQCCCIHLVFLSWCTIPSLWTMWTGVFTYCTWTLYTLSNQTACLQQSSSMCVMQSTATFHALQPGSLLAGRPVAAACNCWLARHSPAANNHKEEDTQLHTAVACTQMQLKVQCCTHTWLQSCGLQLIWHAIGLTCSVT